MVMVKTKSGREFRMDGYLKNLLDGFKYAVTEKNTSVVFIIDAHSGMGKSTIGVQCGSYLDPNFSLAKVYYDPEDFLKGLSNAKKEDFFMYDEAMPISSRSSLSKVNRMMTQAMSMIRSKNIYVVFCINSIFDLDKNLALHRANALIHLYGDNFIDRGKFATFFKAKDDTIDRLKMLYLHGKKFYSYSKPRANFYGNFPPDFLLDQKEYDKKKDKAVNDFLSQIAPASKKSDATSENLAYYMKNTLKITVKEIADVANVTERTIYNMITRRSEK